MVAAACGFCTVLFGSAKLPAATIVNLSPADINGGDTTRTSFSNGLVTLTPTIGGAPATFNASAARLGIDGRPGTNPNAFGGSGAGYNTIFGDADDEGMTFEFAPKAGLQRISWDFSRADGPAPTDGVQFSGFLSDPGAVLSGVAPTAFDSSSVSYSAGVLTIQIGGGDFGDPDAFITLTNISASFGQTLTMTVADSTQAGGQFAITGISVVAVPEPSSIAVMGLIGVATVVARRRITR